MRKKIPSTHALHQSFTRAAEELALTQSAVCRQINALEEYLGVPLFRRTRRGVQLTEAGQDYSRQIGPRLDALEQDTLAVMSQHGTGSTLDLAVVPTFATRWLLPRLGRFQARQPEVIVNLHTQTRPFLFDQTGFDAAIYFGDAGWPGTEAHFLMHEYPVPVCSPTLPGVQPHMTPEAIAELPLLQQSTRPYAWRQWFAAAGVTTPRAMTGMRLELFSMLAQAAIERLADHRIAVHILSGDQQELANGSLISPCPQSMPSSRAYYLIVPEHKAERPALTCFREWLVGESKENA
mgnify:CR=1 FL=1